MLRKLIIATTVIIILISVYHPGRHAKHYPFIKLSDIFEELVQVKHDTLRPNLNTCEYEKFISNNINVDLLSIFKKNDLKYVFYGGEYIPKDCNPLFKTAVIVPYRNRSDHLNIFLNYIHDFLQKQQIHYRIFIVEQNDLLPFNRAKMMNIGAYEAIKQKYPCLILHDVDLLPVNTANMYACAKRPRHMSSSLDTFRFNLPYLDLFGGVTSIQARHFQSVNGLSNEYKGWGGEDDDFSERLKAQGLTPYRFTKVVSEYTMLYHKPERASSNRYQLLNSALKRMKSDGLSTIPKNYSLKMNELYTHILT